MTAQMTFDEHKVLHEIKHYLPAQAPLKDFIHHNTLHAFQNLKFYDGLRNASKIFGYQVSLQLEEYRLLYKSGRISNDILDRIICQKKGTSLLQTWKEKLLFQEFDTSNLPRIGLLRTNWKSKHNINIDNLVHPLLFRILCGYLDQGISIWNFPVGNKGFLASVKELEKNSFTSFFKTKRAKEFLLNDNCTIPELLEIIVGDESLYKQYLFDQQFAHQGWSGMVSTVEDQPETLLNHKNITIRDLITFELLLEIDTLDNEFGEKWMPLGANLINKPARLFDEVPETELNEVFAIWQDAFEWSYYDKVLVGISLEVKQEHKIPVKKSFQAMFCIDDREGSLRHYLEKLDNNCETFGTPGFFSVEFYFKTEHGKFYTKLCPAPITPKYLIKEEGTVEKREKEILFTKLTHSLFSGWLITQTLGFWSALKLFANIFRPSLSPASASSFKHMDKVSKLHIENKNVNDKENDLQIGFTVDEMTQRVESLLKSIGLIKDFAPVIYVLGHGSSTINNPHFSAYDCGACSGRPGSVNARVISFMANHPKVRERLVSKGINIPQTTQFIGGLHDTTMDEISYFDEATLTDENFSLHKKNILVFNRALDLNAKERSRRLVSIDTKQPLEKIHDDVRKRSVTLFEPRPELNHASNALCIVGSRNLTKGLFLDRRSFMNSYDYSIDPEGKLLFGIMKPLGPVCGGINLEYFFSRVDNQKLGAGTKLPHNVMGLFGVANGSDGDLRPGLPSQMIEVHDPVRLLIIVEHFPEVVLKTIQSLPEMYEWFINEWVHLVVINPETTMLSLFKEGAFAAYTPLTEKIGIIQGVAQLIESSKEIKSVNITEATQENLPVFLIK